MATSMTVGLPSFQRRDHLSELLASIAESVAGALTADEAVDVVVVLDGSTDGSLELVERVAQTFPVPLRAVWQPNGGLASARNAIVDAATSDLVWLVDDDMSVTPEAFARHLRHDRAVAPVLMGPCDVPAGASELAAMRDFYADRHDTLAARGFVSAAEECSFANTSAPRDLLLEQRFDQRYRGYGLEDYDLAARLLRHGVRIEFDPAAAIVHRAVPSREERLLKLRQEGANRVRFVHRHPDRSGAAFTPRPARFEQFVRSVARPSLARPLWRASTFIEYVSRWAPLSNHRHRLQYWADTSAVYSGVAAETAASDAVITVVIPAHDAASTIADALGFLTNQTSAAWEAVVVDDGSTDATAEIVADLAARDSRIRLVRRPNGGAAAARNSGRAAATSRWLLFLDADDRIDPTYIATMQAALRLDRTAAGVRCNWAYETDDGRVEPVVNHQFDAGADLFSTAVERSPFAIHSCVIRGDVFDRAGAFDPRLRIGEDWDLWQRVGRTGARLACVPQTLAFYRLRSDSAMRTGDGSATFDALTVYRRTHSEDSRPSQQVARHRAGAAIDPARDVVAERVAWAVGVGVASGGRVLDSLPAHTPPANSWLDPRVVAGTLYEAVPFGLCTLTCDWPAVWATHYGAIRQALQEYEVWAGHGDMTDRVMRHLERMVIGDMVIGDTAIDEPLPKGSLLGVRADISRPVDDLTLSAEIDQVVVTVTDRDGAPLGTVDVPVTTGVLRDVDVRGAVARQLAPTLVRAALRRRSTALTTLASHIDRRRMNLLARFVVDMPRGDPSAVRDLAGRFVRAAVRPPSDLVPAANGPLRAVAGADERHDPDSSGTDYFEQIFAAEDPWAYTSDYEQTKYEQTLSLLDGVRAEHALELACAEGHFTQQLAPHVGRLIAADISPTAVSRASERCAGLDNVDFRVIDLRDGSLPAGQDLIVCSEVLYFLDDKAALAAVAERIAGALVPGGHLLTAHAAITADDPATTGFPWERPFGARRIGEILAADDRLALVREIETPLYRIGLFRRIEPGSTAPNPRIEQLAHGALDRQLHRSVTWGGVTTMRSDAMATEVTCRLPVLMYHRVATTGVAALDRYRIDPERFEAQLDHLRRHGYYGVTAERWTYAMAQSRALPGRAVMITFDDGYRDFLEQAFPLLDAYGFPATVFVVPQLVGESATWDTRFGETAPLLSWQEIGWLASKGIEFGSHSASHVALDRMTARQAYEREVSARSELYDHLGRDVTVLSYPFGVHDAAIRETMYRAGYRVGFTSETGLASVWDNPLRLPRIEVRGDDDLEAFRAELPLATRRNPLRRGIDAARNVARHTVSR